MAGRIAERRECQGEPGERRGQLQRSVAAACAPDTPWQTGTRCADPIEQRRGNLAGRVSDVTVSPVHAAEGDRHEQPSPRMVV